MVDRIANGKLACQGNQCVLNPLTLSVTVAGSSCTGAADCCPDFDSRETTKDAKMTTAETSAAKAVKKACSLANGVDGTKGTDDDTFVDPQSLGYGGSCLAVFGQCGAIATGDTVVSGADSDLVECIACIQSSAGAALSSFHAPPAQ